MKQTLPEDRELEELGSDVSAHYRASAGEEPPLRVDSAILDAARHDAARPRLARNWRLPASIAAMLVVGVLIVLVIGEVEEPLPPLEQSAKQSDIAKPAAPSLAMKAEPQPAPRQSLERESRPSRERGAREDRESQMQTAAPPVAGYADSGPAPSVVAAAARDPEVWLKEIESLLRGGNTAKAREQLVEFRKRYPDYHLPERLLHLLPASADSSKSDLKN